MQTKGLKQAINGGEFVFEIVISMWWIKIISNGIF
jgi:hypothetical protein